ncbi:DUF922 domain-containing protein [Mangrovibrevibacter kandeliae]|uniref:DUF922 domain-containing protein n=1 Tax=Mangrovibrevibacter kandeliae TaxID=2968473 RepID=UPI0021176289|nr:DUF922 domain-containing protein [Aurantimonas sp. CSK15Z-1]MCQ8782920.1 DUF922 domain-containing protein [Aurantimonas sp. CSK15Z-1]
MRKSAAAFAMLLVSMASGSPGAEAVHEKTTYFAVHGSTIKELEAQMALKGPYVAGTASQHPGAIEVSFDGNVNYKRAPGGGCAVDRPEITLQLHIILPKWQVPPDADAVTKVSWKAVINDIETHEKHHAAISREWRTRMTEAIRRLSPQPTCDQMKARVDATTKSYLAGHDAAQLAFDRRESQVVDARVRSAIARAVAALHR